MRKLVLLALITGATGACQDAVSPSAPSGPALSSEASDRAHLDLREERASLVAAGNAASADIADEGLVQGLGAALAQDAIFLSPRMPILQGRAAAIDFLSTNPIAPSDMQWQVIKTDVSNDGTQGYTWAQGTVALDVGTGPLPPAAFFLIYWRRASGGDWQIAALVFNLGGPQSLPLPAGFGTPDTKHRRNFPNTDAAAQRAQLLQVDAAFSAASVTDGLGPAFEHFAAPTAIAVGGDLVFGPEDIGEAFAAGPNDVVTWIPRLSDVAESGDLGFSVGEATFALEGGTFFSKYLTVWQKQNTGEWRYVADLGNSRPAS
jgi:ketosteroid isomerase-like protein